MMEFRQDVGRVLQNEGARCSILLNRMGLLAFYKSGLLDGKELEVEFDNTRPNYSSRKTLEAELLEQVRETA